MTMLEHATAARGPVQPTDGARSTLDPLPLNAVRLRPAGLLGRWQDRNATETLPHCVDQLEADGALANLRRTPGDGTPHRGMWFSDSDVYKTMEAIAWRLATGDGDNGLRETFDALTGLLESAQEADGYLDSFYQHNKPDHARWRELAGSHELYCAGHLIQAAVAANHAGIGARLLPLARRFADLIVDKFGPQGDNAVCGHPEIETALVELFRVTGYRPYLETARCFIDRRGHGLLPTGAFGAGYFQDHLPVREATEATGHAVRQVYLLAGVVDVAVETGDETLLAAAERLWESLFESKTYITGAHGSRHRDEAIGDPYELPPDRAYAETCAAIGSFQWNWRLLLATGKHRYADEMERVLYNGIAVATALDGRHFFYSNPLHLRTGHDGSGEDAPSQRLSWYSCACCPPNLARLVGSLQAYVATSDASGLQIHLYGSSDIEDDHGRSVEIETRYPWDADVSMTVTSRSAQPWTLALRVPGWCDAFTVRVDGQFMEAAAVDGYVRLTRAWSGERVDLHLAMPARLVAAHPRVDAVRGCVALARGPLVYSVEHADLRGDVVLEDVVLDTGVPLNVVDNGEESVIPVALSAVGRIVKPASSALYPSYEQAASGSADTPITLTAVPYFLWGNRTPGPMRVWIPVAAR
jgi:DUF1680 family protein